jgi:hypothetical protein
VRDVAPAKPVSAWWTAWVVTVIVQNIASRGVWSHSSVTTTVVVLEWVLALSLLVGLAFWVPVIRGVSATQNALVLLRPEIDPPDRGWSGWTTDLGHADPGRRL